MEAPLGDQELELLRFIADHAPVTVRDAAERWGEPRGLAKTTVQTMMERLRVKNYLGRVKQDGAFHYAPAVPRRDLLRGLVHDFVQKALGGSFGPLVAYMAEERDLTDAERAVLEKVVRDIEDTPPAPSGETP